MSAEGRWGELGERLTRVALCVGLACVDARAHAQEGAARGPAAGAETRASEDDAAARATDGAVGGDDGDGADDRDGADDAGLSDDAAALAEDELRLGDVVVEGVAEEVFAGSSAARSLGEEELARMDYDDPLSVVATVPGVYVRQEDGYGLRPNIGLRGANSDRSSKITLLEDGVLMGPAPYSAPAAYYFPLVTRMTGVDVYLGPSALAHGPVTIGGGMNFEGRAIPSRRAGGVDLALGSNWFGRFHGHYGDSNEWGGFLIEAIHLRTDGFRHLDFAQGNDSTGFDRTDVLARGELHGDLSRDVFHRLELTLGLGLEGSNETYLGLADADLRADPWRRYGASSTDRMEWWRTRGQLRYELLSEHADLEVTAYRHDLDRTWNRLDRFRDGTGFLDVLRAPNDPRYGVYYGVLTGTDEAPSPGLALLRVTNARTFVSEGVQARGRLRATTGPVSHLVELGLRLHRDSVRRVHTGRGFLIEGGSLVGDGAPDALLTDNRAESVALSGYVAWELRAHRFTVTPIARLELVWSELADLRPEALMAPTDPVRVLTAQQQVSPGLALSYDVVDPVSLFAGVYQGYAPVAPGQPTGTRPELAWNYELGARYGASGATSRGQAAFFLSDYENLVGVCAGSEGCPSALSDVQFNGGAATVLGLELSAQHTFEADEVRVPLRASYTWTYTRFASAFRSENPQFGDVTIGDRLPYVPEHQGALTAGVAWRMLSLDVQALYVSAMRDRASHGPASALDLTDEQFYVDATARVEVAPGISLYVRGENLTNAAPIVARRPFGARTGRPLLVQAGLEASF